MTPDFVVPSMNFSQISYAGQKDGEVSSGYVAAPVVRRLLLCSVLSANWCFNTLFLTDSLCVVFLYILHLIASGQIGDGTRHILHSFLFFSYALLCEGINHALFSFE